MKVRLAYRDCDLDLLAELPSNSDELRQDLGLDILFRAMAGEDRYLLDVAMRTVLTSLGDPEAIRYRQAVLADCLAQPAVVRELYGIAVAAIERERRVWGYSSHTPESLLRRSVDVMGLFLDLLRQLRVVAVAHAADFQSEGFGRLFREAAAELDDAYLGSVEGHLERLQMRDGVRLSAKLGRANRGTDYVLRRRVAKRTWRERIGLNEPGSHVWQLPERDETGGRALSQLRGRGVALAAIALGRSTDHILSYFAQLRAELGFYVGCLNLHDDLTARGGPASMPDPMPAGTPAITARGLYDACLSLSSADGPVVGNDLDADGKSLLVVTGANRGGKSTFLRSLGLAQLMMQAGMFVPARSFRADVRDGLFTHFRREEDASLRSGKLDEELTRMSAIVDGVRPGSLVLFNESFASTNEREGSEIARQIVRALLETGIKVGYVTHMYDLASGFHARRSPDALFLRAERLADGRRTYRVVEGEPLPTSHGEDIYRRIFEAGGASAPDGPAAGAPPAGSPGA